MMQKIIFIILFFSVVYNNLFAQDFEIEDINKSKGLKHKFELGIDAGPSIRWMRGNEYLDYINSPTSGFFSGINFRYLFSNYMSVKFNLIYERKGTISKSIQFDQLGNAEELLKINMNFDYLKVPVLFTYNMDNLFLTVGPYFSYLLKMESSDKITGIENNLTHLNKRFDTGLVLGIGIVAPISDRILVLMEFRNNLGLYNVSKVQVFNDDVIKTNSINLLVGVNYQF